MTTTTDITIRTFNNDYDALARIHNLVFSDFAQSADDFRHDDAATPEWCRQQRWVAERDGRSVAYADYHQHAGLFDPHKFTVEIGVDPEYVQQGIGSALYQTAINALCPFDPTVLSAWCREDMPCYRRFLVNRGFRENMRMWVSILDLTTFEPRLFQRYARIDIDIQIKTRAELARLKRKTGFREAIEAALKVRTEGDNG